MKRMAMVVSVAAVLAWSGPAHASDPTGGYVLVEKVVFEPSEAAPERVQVWGAFTLCKEAGGRNYTPPTHGYLYYAIAPAQADACRKEWADFKRVAGTGQPVGFGSSYKPQTMGRVRKSAEKAETPDPYPVGMGLTRFGNDTEYAPVRGLLTFPIPLAPADGDRVPPGKVTLTVRNIAAKDRPKAAYVFEFEAGGDKEISPAVPAGDKETRWSPAREVKPGEKCTWQARAVDGTWKGIVAASTFQAKGRP
jgi:hypothetical protein